MKFKALSNEKRRLELDMEKINLYVSRYKKFTPFDIEIVRRQKKRSDPMRKLYFGAVLPPYMDHLGYDADETELFHRQLKIVFFRVQKDNKGIYREKDVPSVFGHESDLPITKKQKFMSWVVRSAARDGVYIDIDTKE